MQREDGRLIWGKDIHAKLLEIKDELLGIKKKGSRHIYGRFATVENEKT